jgi:uncharacterized protein YaiL (DUF2058 family)
MAESLRDQLRALGLVKNPETKAPERRSGPPKGGGSRPPPPGGDAQGKGGSQGKGVSQGKGGSQDRRGANGRGAGGARPSKSGEPDLAQAYAARAREEREARERAEREAQERARDKRERRHKLAALVDGTALNVADADVARHFTHGGKIRRVYVTAEQLPQVNRGELGVVQRDGRYLVVTRELALAAQAIVPESLVLLADPNAPPEDDVPPDLVW